MATTASVKYDIHRHRIRKSVPAWAVAFFFSEAGVQLDDSTILSQFNPYGDSYCQPTHILCPDNWYCLPVFVRCNGVYDCPGKEDEQGCKDGVCPGYYRCRGSAVCLHPDHVCDGFPQCTEGDDELLCELTCPEHCICLGLALKCSLTAELPYNIRASDMSGSIVTLSQLLDFVLLVFLDLSSCQMTNITGIYFPNLQTLSLTKNVIKSVSVQDLTHVPNLRHLYLSQNPITALFQENVNSSISPPAVRTLDLSDVHTPQLNVSIFKVFPSLQTLNLSNSGVIRLLWSGGTSLSKLQTLDTRGCSVLEFPSKLFLGLNDLQQLFADTFKLCCPQVLPARFNPKNCHAPVSEISSCDNLLRLDVYRLFLALFATFALSGNTISLLLRLHGAKANTLSGYSVFVTHLSISDWLMGVYLSIIGVADRLYKNTYLWQDTAWKNSVVCKSAGVLAFVSTEMSAFTICLITLDRFLVIRFPFSQLRFQPRSAHMVCIVHWLLVVLLASVPLFPVYAHWGFYSHSDICIPLPITRGSFAGHNFAFGVMIVLNMILFIVIACGQTAIFSAVRTHKMSSTDMGRKQQDMNIARRLITIATTDFLCWFPVGLLGLLASTGTVVPGEVNVAMATLVIPLNSAINPFLYTMNVVMEKRRRAREERIIKFLKSQCDKE